jgi:folate-binding protein YgfZ
MEKLARPALEQLPSSYFARLNQLSAIRVSGSDTEKYLQGQLTCDVNALEPNALLNGGHCDAKGKMFSAFRIISEGSSSKLLIQPQASLNNSLPELKKYGVFSQVEIEQANDLAFALVVGDQAQQLIQDTFMSVPDTLNQLVSDGVLSCAYLPGALDRFLLMGQKDKVGELLDNCQLNEVDADVWQLIEITEGFPVVNEQASGEYVPQMLNLQAVNGISFTKGCYLGQETVARMQYLGKNKRALFALTGNAQPLILSPESIEIKISDNWRRAGAVLNSYQSDTGELYVQAVLASDICAQSELRIKELPEVNLTVSELPYKLLSD